MHVSNVILVDISGCEDKHKRDDYAETIASFNMEIDFLKLFDYQEIEDIIIIEEEKDMAFKLLEGCRKHQIQYLKYCLTQFNSYSDDLNHLLDADIAEENYDNDKLINKSLVSMSKHWVLDYLKDALNIFTGVYTRESHFFSIPHNSSLLSSNIIETINEHPEKYALVVYDCYH